MSLFRNDKRTGFFNDLKKVSFDAIKVDKNNFDIKSVLNQIKKEAKKISTAVENWRENKTHKDTDGYGTYLKSKSQNYLNDIKNACEEIEKINITSDASAKIKEIEDILGPFLTLQSTLNSAATAKFSLLTFGAVLDDRKNKKRLAKISEDIEKLWNKLDKIKEKAKNEANRKLTLNSFAAAKSKFGTDEEAANYFILVELYEKHLTGKQKENFLKADSIDSMLNVLNKNQLKHLRSLLSASLVGQSARSHNDPEFKKEAFSKWYIKNMSGKKINILKLSARIYDKQIEKTKVQDLVSKFNSRLKNFDGDIKEYCQWLILLSVDNSIPSIESIYDVHKLLKPLDLTRLKKLLWKLTKSHNTNSIVKDMERLEPYFYKLATEKLKYSSQHELDILFNEAERTFIEENPSSVTKMFDKERKNLIDTIENLIKEKRTILKSTVAKLGRSKTFEDSLTKVADLIGGDDEIFVKEAIGEYSGIGQNGSAFDNFLRKAKFFEKLSKNEFSSDELKTFRKRMAQVSKYFENHLTDKAYTAYRGMWTDGLKALLDNSTPKICYKTDKNHELIVDDDLIKNINMRNPIVFDEGITSVSLNKGVAGNMYFFRGKTPGNVFLTIKIPPNSKALVLDYEGIKNAPGEEELLIAPKTKIKINSIREVDKHYEIVAQVLN